LDNHLRYSLGSTHDTGGINRLVSRYGKHLVNIVDGLETYADPYAQFQFLEDLRRSQTIVMYQEGTLTANVIVESLDWLPFKRQGNYENGFEGDCVVVMKTIGGYTPYPGYPTQ
jgi:hypothetical protein